MNLEKAYSLIENNNYFKVPDNLAINDVYKLEVRGDLNTLGYEFGYLYLPSGSGINTHTHTVDIERYLPIVGKLSVNNNIVDKNICLVNENHNIDIVLEDTIIEYTKVSLSLIDNYDESIFDNVHK